MPKQPTDHIRIKNRAQWRDWLNKHHNSLDHVWVIHRKGANRTLSYDDIVEEALCFGWIDSASGKVDESYTKLYLSRRKPKSAWSRSNKLRVKKLEADGVMTDAGRAAIAIAKSNGSWDTLEISDRLVSPKELTAALKATDHAETNFTNYTPATQRMTLEWLYSAKTEATRLKRAQRIAEEAAHETASSQFQLRIFRPNLKK